MTNSESAAAVEVWKLQPSVAKLSLPPLGGEISFGNPADGVGKLVWNGNQLRGQVLGVSAGDSSTLQDVFTRGADLVAVYAVTQPQSSSWQVYWRVTAPEACVVQLDAIVSLQTPLLESFPSVSTQSELSAEQVWLVPSDHGKARQVSADQLGQDSQLDCDCLVLRGVDGNWSYAEMTHPVDRGSGQLALATDGLTRVQRNLGGSFLEKGVIRRMRLRGAFLPRENDLERAAQFFKELAAETPPLTA